jgi:hypothetical protein
MHKNEFHTKRDYRTRRPHRVVAGTIHSFALERDRCWSRIYEHEVLKNTTQLINTFLSAKIAL